MCPSCGSAGTCNCSSITIPIGPQGPSGPQGITGNTGLQGPQGLTGPQGIAGTTPAKYANTFIITTPRVVLGNPAIPIPITISYAAIVSPNALISTSASTPEHLDFNTTVWFINNSQYREVTSDTSYITSIIFDTTSDILTIQPAVTGEFRVIIFG